jgi:hypothetical protein
MEAKNDKQNARGADTKIYLTPDSTLQTPSESREDEAHDVRKDDSISVSHDDLHDPNTERETSDEEMDSED